MAWNGKHSLESASKSLSKTLSSLKTLLYECNVPLDVLLLRIWIIVIASVNFTVAWLKEETIRKGWFAHLATCRCGASAALSSNTKSLVTDENTWEWQVWLIKAYDYMRSARLLNMPFCTHLMQRPFFFSTILHIEYYHTPWYSGKSGKLLCQYY